MSAESPAVVDIAAHRRRFRPVVIGDTHVNYETLRPFLPLTEDGGVSEAARRTGVSRRTFNRWQRCGLIPIYAADRVAIALGYHPACIWPEIFGRADKDREASIVFPGSCATCGRRVVLVRGEPAPRWLDPITRRPCVHREPCSLVAPVLAAVVD